MVPSSLMISQITAAGARALAARHADQVVLMNRGVLASGTPGEVFRDPQMKATFGMGLDVLLGGESA